MQMHLKVFSVSLATPALFLFDLLVPILLQVTDVFSLVAVALATTHARISALEAELKVL
jgi:hypothetical protein